MAMEAHQSPKCTGLSPRALSVFMALLCVIAAFIIFTWLIAAAQVDEQSVLCASPFVL